MHDDKRIDPETGTETTGHSWDGIEELNTPLPRWWLWTFYATIVWGVGYTILFPAWPMVSGATTGLLGYSTRAEVAADIARVEQSNAALTDSLTTIDLDALERNEELHRFAVQAGRSVFAANCSQCHGAGAAGVAISGYPNLLDDDWLWGGTLEDIAYTVRHGIRNEEDWDSRYSEMPAFDWMETGELAATADFVRSLSGLDHDAQAAARGADLFADNCSACHGESGLGDREVGAPNLADAIWLRGGTQEDIIQQMIAPRHGVMPPWGQRLGEAEVRAVSAYVHGLGGGENPVADPMSDPESENAADVPDASFPAGATQTPTETGEPPVQPAD
ncbi:cytochrome-c oxidase, cbb3-type subunit III [Loktanella sp. SALINAS62]|uniref:cytochrome-c oxidase, cbb3-type subunit III n=1 Tax=Loktanella sp. SALINAS62 TaxID=2706124 RepID=UPI001B8C998F|nr:cytochrome-c oxidase, cbb3-type subunit III [Loktanella sp. SALINAS62]